MEVAWRARIVSEGAADAADVDVDRARIAVEVEAPHGLDELIAREHAPLIAREQPEHIEFARLQTHGFSIQRHLAALRIDGDRADDAPRSGFERRRARAAQDGAHARDQLAW